MYCTVIVYCNTSVLHLQVPGVGLTPTDTPDKDQMSRALSHAKTSTASVGKFTSTLPKEKPAKNMGRKRKVGIVLCDSILKRLPIVIIQVSSYS